MTALASEKPTFKKHFIRWSANNRAIIRSHQQRMARQTNRVLMDCVRASDPQRVLSAFGTGGSFPKKALKCGD